MSTFRKTALKPLNFPSSTGYFYRTYKMIDIKVDFFPDIFRHIKTYLVFLPADL